MFTFPNSLTFKNIFTIIEKKIEIENLQLKKISPIPQVLIYTHVTIF